MKRLRALTACALILNCMRAFGGAEQSRVATATEEFNPPRFEFAIESAFLFGAINPPASYEIGAEFLTARVRWGVVRSDFTRVLCWNRFFAESKIIISDSISECATTLFNPAAGLFHTFREALAQAQSTATPRFLVDKARTLRSTFYRPPAFRTT